MSEVEELLRINEELRYAVRARDEFLAIASHELRSPMHALLLQVGNVLVAARRGSDEKLVARLEAMQLVIDSYVRRATTLLEISRVNSSELHLKFDDCDLAEIVRQTIESYSAEAAFYGVHVEVASPTTLRGKCDRGVLEQIVINLVSNALKYGDNKPVEVRLHGQHDIARLEVRDYGIGISEANQARIFNRFEQLVTDQPRDGFGIGLWLVRNLVDAHNGSIQVESSPGKGATFIVCLPIDGSRKKRESA